MKTFFLMLALLSVGSAYGAPAQCATRLFVEGFDFALAAQNLELARVWPEPQDLDRIIDSLHSIEDPSPEMVRFLELLVPEVGREEFGLKVSTHLILWGKYSSRAVFFALADYAELLMGGKPEGRSVFCAPGADTRELRQSIKHQVVRMGNELRSAEVGELFDALNTLYFSDLHTDLDREREALALPRGIADKLDRKRLASSAFAIHPNIRARLEIDRDDETYRTQTPWRKGWECYGPNVGARTLIAEIVAEWARDRQSPLSLRAVEMLIKMGKGQAVTVRTFERILREPSNSNPAVVARVESFMQRAVGTELEIKDVSANLPALSP